MVGESMLGFSCVTNQWIATKLDMGHDRSVSRLIRKAPPTHWVIETITAVELGGYLLATCGWRWQKR